MTGIYVIINNLNNKKYYGSSKNIKKRWYRHKYDLNKKQHNNDKLQRAWNKYGKENFTFKIIELCPYDELLSIEQKYLDLSPEYNIGLKSSGGDNITNNPNKQNIIKKIKKGCKIWRDSLSDEEKQIIRNNLVGEKNPNWRGGKSKKYCKCGKQITPNNKTCTKCYNRFGKNNSNYGNVMDDERKKFLSDLFKGKCLHHNNKEIIIDDVEYSSFKDAERKLNINWGTIRWRVLSKNPKYKNYCFKGEEKTFFSEEEQKERISKSQKGKQTNFNKPFLIDGVEYRTLKEASEKLKIHFMTIKGRLDSKNVKYDNYKYSVS